MDKKLLSKLGKVYKLAAMGHEGEQESAKALLVRLMDKHGVTIDQVRLAVEDEETFIFPYSTPFEKLLLVQIYCSEFDTFNMPHQSHEKDGQMVVLVQLNPKEGETLQRKFDLLKTALSAELDKTARATFAAFLNINHLFGPDAPDAKPTQPDYSQGLYEELMAGMSPVADPQAPKLKWWEIIERFEKR